MHPGWELRSLDFLGDRQALKAAALADLEAVGGKNYRAPQYEEAGDSTNTVRVAVSRKLAVMDVHISSEWRAVLRPHNLGPALLEAHRNATTAMMNSLALASLAEQERKAADGEGHEPSEPDPLPEAPDADIKQIWRMLSDVEDMMYRADKMSRQAAADNTRTVHGTLGLFKGVCEGRALVSISAELTLIQQVDTEQLRSAALDLFRQVDEIMERENL